MDGRGDNREIHLLHCNSQAPCVKEKRRAIEREALCHDHGQIRRSTAQLSSRSYIRPRPYRHSFHSFGTSQQHLGAESFAGERAGWLAGRAVGRLS